jgi:hypothetical protein
VAEAGLACATRFLAVEVAARAMRVCGCFRLRTALSQLRETSFLTAPARALSSFSQGKRVKLGAGGAGAGAAPAEPAMPDAFAGQSAADMDD